LVAENCILKEVAPQYFGHIIEWRNNAQYNKYLNQPFVLTLEAQSSWYERYVKDGRSKLYIFIDIHGTPFGTIGVKQIDLERKSAEFGNYLIIESHQGSMEMLEGLVKFLEECFEELNLLYGSVSKDNKKSIKFCRKMGFVTGSKKDFPFQEAQETRDDLVAVSLTKADFYDSEVYRLAKERL
jgi:RimJ/RimL family protein N-acetyltransferase